MHINHILLLLILPGVLIAGDPSKQYKTLADLFETDAPLNPGQVSFRRLSEETVESCFFPGNHMERINLEFTSQVYRGIRAKHKALLLIPSNGITRKAKGATAIILGGGNLLSLKNPEKDWIEHLVVQQGIPCLVVMNAFNAKEFGAKNPGELMSFGSQSFLDTGDPREDGYYALAKIFSATSTVAGQIPEIKAERFIVTGSSKGGMAALIACAGDPRIVGCFPTAWNSGNVPQYTRLKGERWGWHIKPKETGPAGMTAASVLEMVSTPRYQEYLRLFDPHEWGKLLKDKFAMPAVGTNDPLFHLLSNQYYYKGLQSEKAFLMVPNYPHGRGATEHAKAWRFAVAAALLDRPVPLVKLKSNKRKDEIEYQVSLRNVSNNPQCKVHWTTDPTGDYRKAKWNTRSVPLPDDLGKSFSIGKWKTPAKGTLAVYIEFSDDHELGESIVCSNIIETGQAVTYSLNKQ